MTIGTHGLLSWILANAGRLDARQRRIVVIAGLAPDLDGFGYPVQWATAESAQPLNWYSDYHHVLSHNLAAAILVSLFAYVWSGKMGRVAILSLAAFHLHLLCDLAGSGGGPGDIWPLAYLWPFTAREFCWQGQWPLGGWQNTVITFCAEVAVVALAWQRGFSPVSLFSEKWDQRVFDIFRRMRLKPPTP